MNDNTFVAFSDRTTLQVIGGGVGSGGMHMLRSRCALRHLRFPEADGYLDGLTIVHQDYRRLFRKYQNQDGVCFLIDPPYLSTQATTYTGYWKLRDYLDVLHTLHDTNYFYFTSEKSSILELCEWLDDEYQTGNPFKGATRIDYATNLNYSAGFIDIMLYKHQPTERRNAA